MHTTPRVITVLALVTLLGQALQAQESPSYDGVSVDGWARRLSGKYTKSGARRALGDGGDDALPVIRALLSIDRGGVAGEAAAALRRHREFGAPAIPELVALIASKRDAGDRVHALRTLPDLGSAAAQPAIPALTAALRDQSHEVRQAAATTCGLLAPIAHDAIPNLTTGLGDSVETVRRQCAYALGRIGAKALGAAEALTTLLEDEQPHTRSTAATALWKIGPAAVEHIVTLLREGKSEIAVAALVKGGEQAVPLLVGLLSDSNVKVRTAAESALVKVGWVSVPALREKGEKALVSRVLSETPLEMIRLPDRHTLRMGKVPDIDAGSISIDWETGSGHGGSFALSMLRWGTTGLEAHRIRYMYDRRSTEIRKDDVVLESAVIPKARARAMIDALVHVSALRLEELPRKKGSNISGGTWGSSANFHISLKVDSGERAILEGSYTGYRNSRSVPDYFRLRIANLMLRQALDAAQVVKHPVADAHLERLSERLKRFKRDSWWVQERLLTMVEMIGDDRFMPFLKELIKTPPERVKRRHVLAINAYALFSRKDLRTVPFGEKDVLEVRQRYLDLWR